MTGLLLIASLLFARLPFANEMRVEPTAAGTRLSLGEDERVVAGDDLQEIAEAWMKLVDARENLSARPEWRRINRWSDQIFGSSKPANTALYGFVGLAGHLSPRDDFASFASAALLEPHDASDDRLACRLRTQWRFVTDALASLPAESQPAEPPDEPPCSAFRRWADVATLSHVELILAAPSSASAGSLFGHLMLRLVRTDGSMRDAEILAFLAQNDVPIEADPLYVVKGLTGAYTASLAERSLPRTLDEYVIREGRSLERFRLHLSDEETTALLDRLWTARNALELPYYFLQDNCATMLLDLLRDVLDDDAAFAIPSLLGASPTAALEGLALVRRANDQPLLTPVHEAFTSLHQEAIEAARTRREAQLELQRLHPALATAFEKATSKSPQQRADAIDGLGHALQSERSPAVDAWLASQATIELHLSREANAFEEKKRNRRRFEDLPDAARESCARLTTLEASTRKLVNTDRARRHEGYAELADALVDASEEAASLIRQCAALHLVLHYGDDLKTRPEVRESLFFVDPSEPLEDQTWAAPVRELLAYEHVTALMPGVFAVAKARRLRKSTLGAVRPLWAVNTDRRAERTELAADRYERGWPHTGIDRTTLGFTAATDGWGVQVGGAIYDERLGDRRRYGFAGHTAFSFLASEWNLGPWQSSVRVIESHLRLFGWRSIAPALAEEEGVLGRLGWDVFLDVDRSLPRGISSEARAGVGWLLPLAASRDASTHLLLRAGGDLSGALGESDRRIAWGPAGRLGLEARWTPSFTGGWHYLEAHAEGRSTWDFPAGRALWDAQAHAAVSIGIIDDVAMPFVGRAGLRLSVGVRHERASGPFVPLNRTSGECVLTID